MKKGLACICLLLQAACGSGASEQLETFRITEGTFAISLLAAGELRAAESTPITPPPDSRNPRTISWLSPNYTAVKKGDLVVRFDVSDAELGALEAGIELTKVNLQVLTKDLELERLMSGLSGEMDIINIEKTMSEEFAVEDTMAYSRMAIIDATRDRALLDYRVGHLEDKEKNYQARQSAEFEVLEAVRATRESEKSQHQRRLEQSEVRAPHDGIIVYEKNWWGLQVDVGATVFPGNKIATLPDLNRMEAVLLVQEIEAVGLATGQAVDLTMDAWPDRPITGRVASISATAAPGEQDSPVKYFRVIVAVDQSDPEWITPGAQLTAEIHISRIDNTIAVPNQALFRDEAGDWVMAVSGEAFERRRVTLGVRGANRSQVASGLRPGDEVALYPPGA